MAADGSIKIDTKIDSTKLPGQLKAMETACKSSTGVMGNAFAKLRDIMQGPVLAAKMVKDGLVAIGKAVIGPAAEIEDFVAAFTPLTGSVEDAKKMINALNKEAATTPFELRDIASVGKQLLPVLGNNVKAVTETFRMLGDTAGGNAEKLDSIARGYVKVMNTGKVSMEALNMISDAGVPIQGQLAKSMGITVEEMYKLSSQGKISSSELTKAFQTMTKEGGLFYNGMSVASETLSGKVSTMNDAFNMAAAAVGERLLPYVKDAADAATSGAEAFTDWATSSNGLTKTIDDIKKAGAPAFDNLKESVKNVISPFKTLTDNADVFKRAFSTLGEIFKNIATGLTGIINFATEGIGKVLEKFLLPAFIKIVDAWEKVQSSILVAQASLKANFAILGSRIAEVFIVGFNSAKVAALSFAQIIITNVLGTVEKMLDALSNLPLVGDMFKKAKDKVSGFSKELDNAAESAKKESKDAIQAAKDKQDIIEDAAKKEIAAIKAASDARRKNVSIIIEETGAIEDNEDAQKGLNGELEKTPSIFDDIRAGFDKAFGDFVEDIKADAADWSDTFKSMGSAVKNGIGKSFQQVGEMIVNGGGFKEFGKIALQSLADILKALGDQLAAMAVVKFLAGDMAGALAAGAGSAAALVASGIAGAMASAANAADQLAQNTAAAVVSLSDILRGGKSSYEDYLGQKQVDDFSKSLADLKTKQEAQQKALAYWREEERKAYADVAANISQFGNTIQEQMSSSAVAYFENAVKVTQKEVDALDEVYAVVYKNNKVTAVSSEILEQWSIKLKENIIAFGKESTEVKAVNEQYQRLLNDALYPTKAALEDANATLKTNSTLWTDAAKATYAYQSSLSAIREKAASFYESFSNIGADIADTLVDSLVDGLDETSFLDAMKEYIMKMVVQAAVYTTELTDRIAKIGQRIATAIASGMTGDALAGIKNDLSSLFQEASGKASAVMGIVNSAFSGNAGVNSIANGLGGSLAPAVATTGGQTININLTSQNVTQLDGRTIAVSVAENIDTVLAAM